MFASNCAPCRRDESPMDGVSQLSNVSRPGMLEDQLQCVGGKSGLCFGTQPASHLALEDRHELGDVFTPLPQRRELEFEYRQPVVEILAKFALGHRGHRRRG